jgi:hypothetical protein
MMIQQIISHTPVYVWALLAFLIYRGFLASRDREISLLKLSIVPLVMMGLSLSGLNGHGVLGAGVWGVWAAGLLAGAAITWKLQQGTGIVVNRAAGTLFQRGSWTPLVLMMAIFGTKYMVAVFSAMHPEAPRQLMFALSVTTLYGLFSGVFAGRMARYVAAWLQQPATAGA